VKRLFEWSVFLTVAVGVWLFAGPTSLGGPASYVVVDGRSMEPTYRNGDLVVAYEQDVYEVGDVIVYDAVVEGQFNVIHRIVERGEGGFVTQGDNRDEVDGWLARDDEIFGAARVNIPNGGALVGFLRDPATILALLAGFGSFEYLRRKEREQNARQEDASHQAEERAAA
jgi:signal peptidase I